jgi:hypothetical protein
LLFEALFGHAAILAREIPSVIDEAIQYSSTPQSLQAIAKFKGFQGSREEWCWAVKQA